MIKIFLTVSAMQTFDKMIRRVKKVLAALILIVIIFISYLLIMYQFNTPIKTVNATKMDMAKMDINKNMAVAENSQLKSKKTMYCDNTTVPNHSPLVDHWQRVDTYGTAYVFSAYVSGPAQQEVFIIGALKDGEATAEDVLVVSAMGDEKATFYCIYWLLGHYTETMFRADVVTIPKKEKARYKYATVLLLLFTGRPGKLAIPFSPGNNNFSLLLTISRAA